MRQWFYSVMLWGTGVLLLGGFAIFLQPSISTGLNFSDVFTPSSATSVRLSKYRYLANLLSVRNQKILISNRIAYQRVIPIAEVLSILNEYYVDSERVAPAHLLQILFKEIQGFAGLKVKRTSNGWRIIQEGSRQFPLAASRNAFPGTGVLTQRIDSNSSFPGTAEKKMRRTSIFLPNVRNMDSALLISYIAAIGNFIDKNSRGYDLNVVAGIDPFIRSEENSGALLILSILVGGLDSHSGILSSKSYQELISDTEGEFGGLGIIVGIENQILTVLSTMDNSPAKRLGIEGGDQILAINSKETFGLTLPELVDYIRGSPGSQVTLTILRKKSLRPWQVKLRREIIQVASTRFKKISRPYGDVVAISIDSFTSKTRDEVVAAINQAKSDPNRALRGVILDLRGNPGGLLSQAINVADLFLREGMIVSTHGRDSQVDYATRQKGIDVDLPVIVITDSDSASASEVLAGALRDNNRAIIIGERSYGKGSVQSVFELPRQRAVKLTIARYHTPSGTSIQGTGITPDIELQPVFHDSSNLNLMGYYRYSNDRFSRDLQTFRRGADQFKNELQRVKSQHLRAYYLYNSLPSEAGHKSEESDKELAVATFLFDELFRIHGKKAVLPRYHRTNRWLRVTKQTLARKLGIWNQLVVRHLSEKHNINWQKNLSSVLASRASLKLRIRKDKNQKRSDSNRFFPVSIQVANESSKAVGRVSVFIRDKSNSIETHETLIGVVQSGQKSVTSIPIKIPHGNRTRVRLEAGLAVDGKPINSTIRKLVLPLKHDKPRKISISSRFDDSFDNGKFHNKLESNEKAHLVVTLSNPAKVPIQNILVKLFNLSGKQIEIQRTSLNIVELLPLQKRTIRIPITGVKITDQKIRVGLLVDGQSLQRSHKKLVILDALSS